MNSSGSLRDQADLGKRRNQQVTAGCIGIKDALNSEGLWDRVCGCETLRGSPYCFAHMPFTRALSNPES